MIAGSVDVSEPRGELRRCQPADLNEFDRETEAVEETRPKPCRHGKRQARVLQEGPIRKTLPVRENDKETKPKYCKGRITIYYSKGFL